MHNLLIPISSFLAHRQLLRGFVAKEIRGRYAGSMVGMLWTLLNPLATMAVYLFVFSLVLRVQVTQEETGTDRFVFFFLCGFFPWLIFADSLARAANSLLQNAGLITKVVFPVELLPLSAVLCSLLVNGIGLALFLVGAIAAGLVRPEWAWLMALLPLMLVFAWGLAMLLAALSVFIRDVPELLGIVLMAWFFCTPIIYPATMIPPAIAPWMALNPMHHFIQAFRDCLIMNGPNLLQLALLTGLALTSYGLGAWFFMRAKPAFGDVL